VKRDLRVHSGRIRGCCFSSSPSPSGSSSSSLMVQSLAEESFGKHRRRLSPWRTATAWSLLVWWNRIDDQLYPFFSSSSSFILTERETHTLESVFFKQKLWEKMYLPKWYRFRKKKETPKRDFLFFFFFSCERTCS
jgi:hypothetical protein